MDDLERIKLMAELNWKPASQYWHELYVKSQAKVDELEQRIKLLEK